MTLRADLGLLWDRIAIEDLITGYAVAVDDGDWEAYRGLFAPGGRADYTSAGGIAGPAAEVAEWLAGTMTLFPVRQHLIVNRRVRAPEGYRSVGDPAWAGADFLNPMRLVDPADPVPAEGSPGVPNFCAAGRYSFSLTRVAEPHDWRFAEVVVREKWKHLAG
ncbi:nuclear transport factor 2 family protein [Streptomyces sp. BI20]|uniref:nuclear transport factor 2 family protein n=1 Tax=Streptomyces sp. BI20 TaxID=3403460 RepID=UPI003C7282C1